MDALEPAATEGQSSSEHLSHSGNPGAAAPLVAPGSTNVLPPSQKTTRANYPNPLPIKGERGKGRAG